MVALKKTSESNPHLERKGSVFTIRCEEKRLLDLPAVHHVPQPDGTVPGGAGQDGLNRTEAQAADGTFVSPEDLDSGRMSTLDVVLQPSD